MESFYKLLILFTVIGCVKNQELSVGDCCTNSKTKKSGVCKRLDKCPSAVEELNRGQLPYTCSTGSAPDHHPIVCCAGSDTCTSNRAKTSKSETKCLEYTESFERLDTYVPFIVNGKNASLGEYPHMAALGYDIENNEIGWLCGGSLISEKYVLTAAHCLKYNGADVKYVKLGTVDLTNGNGNIYNVFIAIPHPDYKPPAKYHDIALLELEETVRFTINIRPACLYTSTDLSLYKTKSLHVTGYGTIEYGGLQSKILQYVILDLYTQEECLKQYAVNRRSLPRSVPYDIMVCAGKRDGIADACQGDSGGPLQLKIYKQLLHSIVGIISSGKGCGAQNVPGLYTRVAPYVKWIEDIVWV